MVTPSAALLNKEECLFSLYFNLVIYLSFWEPKQARNFSVLTNYVLIHLIYVLRKKQRNMANDVNTKCIFFMASSIRPGAAKFLRRAGS